MKFRIPIAMLVGLLIGSVTSYSALAAGGEHSRGRHEAEVHERRAPEPETRAGRDALENRSKALSPERRADTARDARVAERSPRDALEKTRNPREVLTKQPERLRATAEEGQRLRLSREIKAIGKKSATEVAERFLRRQYFRQGVSDADAKRWAKNYSRSFEGTITARLTKTGEHFDRYTGKKNDTGSFLTHDHMGTPEEARRRLELHPEKNDASYRQAWIARRSSIVLEGNVRGGDARQTLHTEIAPEGIPMRYWRHEEGQKYSK